MYIPFHYETLWKHDGNMMEWNGMGFDVQFDHTTLRIKDSKHGQTWSIMGW